MRILDTSSLAATLENLNAAFNEDRPLGRDQCKEIATWLSSRQGITGSYAGMFAPTEKDYREPSRLFSGEKLTTAAGTSHVLGEEACRALILLDVAMPKARHALQAATEGILDRLPPADSPRPACTAAGPARFPTGGTCPPEAWITPISASPRA